MDELTRRAMAAYFRACTKDGAVHSQPSNTSGLETIGELQYVVLRNSRGTMAVYRVRNDGKLKGMRRWPAELDTY